jgi:hypothetical protein
MSQYANKLLSLVLLFPCLVLLSGCSQPGKGTKGEEQKFLVRYEAQGTFAAECDIFYITRSSEVAPDQENKGGVSLQDKVSLPWSLSFEITVTKLHPFNTLVSAVCGDNIANSAEVAIFIDDVEKARDSKTGRNVSATAEYRLTLD